MGFAENLKRFMGRTEPVILAARLTERGFKTSEQTIGLWLRGEREPKAEVITALALALNITPNDLLGFGSKKGVA